MVNAMKTTSLVAIPALLLFGFIRYYLGDFGGYSSLITIKNTILHDLSRHKFYIPYGFYLPFGTSLIIAFLNIKKIDNGFLKKSLYVLPFVFAQLLLADIARMIFLAFPIIIPISLYLFKVNYSRTTLLTVLGISIFTAIFNFIGVLKFSGLTTNNIWWALLNSLLGILIIIIVIQRLSSKSRG